MDGVPGVVGGMSVGDMGGIPGGSDNLEMDNTRAWDAWAQQVDHTMMTIIDGLRETRETVTNQQCPTWDPVQMEHFMEDVKNTVQDYKNGVHEEYTRYMEGAEKIQSQVDVYISESGKKLEEKFQRTLEDLQVKFLDVALKKLKNLA
jgi:hypothetical protein